MKPSRTAARSGTQFILICVCERETERDREGGREGERGWREGGRERGGAGREGGRESPPRGREREADGGRETDRQTDDCLNPQHPERKMK